MRFNQNTIRVAAAAVVVAFGVMASDAYATTIKIGYGSHHFGVGGEFVVKSDGTDASNAFVNDTKEFYDDKALLIVNGVEIGFETFCIEYNQYITIGHTYNYQVSAGSIGGQSTAVSVGTAYLYGLFARGSLDIYFNNLGDPSNQSAKAGDLQKAIWSLQGYQVTGTGTLYNSLLDAVRAEFGDDATSASANSTSYGDVTAASFGVAALNLGGKDMNWSNQDQLVYRGGGFRRVPDGGATVMFLGVAIGGLSLLRRKLA